MKEAGGSTRHPTRHPTPGLGAVVREQLRAVGLAVRREGTVLALLVLVPGLLSLFYTLRGGGAVSLSDPADVAGTAMILGLAAPLAVWKGEERFGSSALWFLPVGHRRHAIAKVTAGWAWVMVTVAAILLWTLLLVHLAGGTLASEESRLVVDASAPSGLRSVAWTTPWWGWAAVFAGATAAYLLASALLLATRHPWRWLAGIALAVLVLGLVSGEGGIDWLQDVLQWTGIHLLLGPYGLDALLTGGAEILDVTRELPSGETVQAWTGLPTFDRWAPAALVWLTGGVAAVFGAASRHREG